MGGRGEKGPPNGRAVLVTECILSQMLVWGDLLGDITNNRDQALRVCGNRSSRQRRSFSSHVGIAA